MYEFQFSHITVDTYKNLDVWVGGRSSVETSDIADSVA